MSTDTEDRMTVDVEEGVRVLEIRKGKANDIPVPLQVKLSGNIKAPGQFLQKRRTLFGILTTKNGGDSDKTSGGPELPVEPLHKINECNIVVDRRKLSITLRLNERDERGAEITGTLAVNPDLVSFGINSNATFGLKELIKMLRHKRVFFADVIDHQNLISALSNFTASQTTDLEANDDRRGNQKLLIDKKTKLTIPFNFMLRIPLYDGFEPKKFVVDVLVDVTDANATFFLESIDLSELLVKERDAIFEKELEQFVDFVVVEK